MCPHQGQQVLPQGALTCIHMHVCTCIVMLVCALQHNTFSEDIPICIIMKGMGVETDQALVELIAGDNTAMVWCGVVLCAVLHCAVMYSPLPFTH